MFKLSIKNMVRLIIIMTVFMAVMFGLDYLGFDLSAPINIPVNIPSGDNHPSMSPTGAMSGTIG